MNTPAFAIDLTAPLLAADPSAPRLTTYTDAGRMELSGTTCANWQAKVANLLLSLGTQPGDRIAVTAAAGWQPAMIALGAWRIGATLIDGAENANGNATDSAEPVAFITDDPTLAADSDCDHIYLLSADPFGRGVAESGGDVPFGVEDFSPELRVHPDAYLGPDFGAATARLDSAASPFPSELPPEGSRVLCGPWSNVAELATALAPLATGGSVVVTTDTTPERIQHLLAVENATVGGRLHDHLPQQGDHLPR